jgi:hypothetical protein
MLDMTTLEKPIVVTILYLVFYIARTFTDWRIDTYCYRIARLISDRNQLSQSFMPVQGLLCRIKIAHVSLGSAALLASGYWEAVPRSVFGFLSGVLVVDPIRAFFIKGIPVTLAWRASYYDSNKSDCNHVPCQVYYSFFKEIETGVAMLYFVLFCMTYNVVFAGAAASCIVKRTAR